MADRELGAQGGRQPRRGDRFTHDRWLSQEWTPCPGQTWAADAPHAECVVTAVRAGVVYYASTESGADNRGSAKLDLNVFVSRFGSQLPHPEGSKHKTE